MAATVQDKIDAAVWVEGSSFPYDPKTSKKILKRLGLTREEVTETMLDRAHRHARNRLRDGFKEFNRIAKGKGVRRQFVVEGDPELDPELNPNMEGTAKFRAEIEAQKKKEMLERLATLRKSKLSADHTDDSHGSSITQTERRTKMDITILQARNLLTALGIDHDKWSTKKVSLRINALPELLDKASKEPEGGAAKLLTAISKSLQEGKAIMVTDPDACEELLKPKKADKPKKKVQSGAKPKEEGVPARINAAMNGKPTSLEKIAEKSGVDVARVKQHCMFWVRKGKMEKTEKGFYIVS